MKMELMTNPPLQMLIENNAYALLSAQRVEHTLFDLDIPELFITDLDSIPWLGRLFIVRNGPQRLPAIPHDFLHVTQIVPLWVSNLIMLHGMEYTNTAWFQRFLIYNALRVGSFLSWNRNTRRIQEEPKKFYNSYGLSYDWIRSPEQWFHPKEALYQLLEESKHAG